MIRSSDIIILFSYSSPMEETEDVRQAVERKKMFLQQRESTTSEGGEGGKSRWNLVRNALHFIKNTKENKEEKPDLGDKYSTILEL